MVDVFKNIRGIIGSIFQLGITGPQIKDASGVIEARNVDDSAYTKMRAADPVDAQDVVTKNYFDTYNLSSNGRRVIRFVIGTDASTDSTAVLPDGCVVMDTKIKITTAYSGGTGITVGDTATADLFMAANENLPQAPAGRIYSKEQDTEVATGTVIRVAISGTPAAGAGIVIVEYAEPLS